MAQIIAVTNRKGGVGKSTMATTLSAGLATRGARVGLVDTDSQGHAGLMLGMKDENGLFNAMIEKQPLEQVVRVVSTESYSTPDLPSVGALYLLPSSDRTFQIPHMLKQEEAFLFLETMEQMIDLYKLDVVVIDTNPTLSMLDGSIFLAADAYLYVTECEMLAFDGVQSAITQMQRFGVQREKYLGRKSHILGIVPNKMRPKTRLHRHNIRMLAEAFPGLVWSPITLGTIWSEATNAHELIYTYAPSGQEAEDAWKMVARTEEALASWYPATQS